MIEEHLHTHMKIIVPLIYTMKKLILNNYRLNIDAKQ